MFRFRHFANFLFEEMLQIPQGGTRSVASIPIVELCEECKDHSWQSKGAEWGCSPLPPSTLEAS